MNKVTQSILLAGMLAASGFALAQTPTAPATRAEVKAEARADDTKGGTGDLTKKAANPMNNTTSDKTRAEVKANVGDAASKNGEIAKPAMKNAGSDTTRAEVKSGITAEAGKPANGEVAPMAAGTSKTTVAERKRMRADKRAMAKAKRDAKMKQAPMAN